MLHINMKYISMFVLFFPLSSEATSVYYTKLSPDFSNGWIKQMNIDGSAVADIREVGYGLRGLAIGANSNSLYWSDVNSDRIERVDLDNPRGTPTNLVNTGLAFPMDIKLSNATGQLFWTDLTLSQVEVVNTDGTGRSVLFSAHSAAIAVDDENRKVYSENRSTAARGSIVRSNFDGSGFEVLIEDVPTATDIAVDPINEFIYWTSSAGLSNGNGGIYRVGFDGSNFVELFAMGSNLDTAALALDIANGKLYWAQEIRTNRDSIYEMNLDGSGVEAVKWVGGSITEMVLSESTVVPVPAAFWLFGSGLLAFIRVAWQKRTEHSQD